MNINIDYTLEIMKKYMDIPSPGGYTHLAIEEFKNDVEKYGLATQLTKKGALIIEVPGENNEEAIMITAHMDTLGGMVKEITSEGKIRFHKIGGGTWNALEGENCWVINRKHKKIRGSIMPKKASTHVYGAEVAGELRTEHNIVVRIDEKVSCKKDVEDLGIKVGDFVCLDTRTEITESGFIKSRYIDDKSAVAMILEICRYFKENGIKPKYKTYLYISNYEEIGHGLSFIPEDTKEVVAIDIGTVGHGQESTEYAVSIAAKDAKGPYDFNLMEKLTDVAESNNVDYKIDVYNRYSSDASQAILRGADIQFACIGPGVDGTHHYERTHKDAIENTLKLLIGYMVK